MSKAILVLGATGKQGAGVVRALLAHPDFSPSEYTIFAATRDPTSAAAQRLAALSPAVQPVTGDLRTPAPTFANLPSTPWAVFLVTCPGATETADGVGAIDAAVSRGASHLVFSSVDGGPQSPPTEVSHFICKHRIEAHLRDVAARSGGTFSYTIIRPPSFLDNLEPGFFAKVMATMWRDALTQPMSVVDPRDIGGYAAAALLERASPVYRNAEFDVAGDKLTFAAADAIFREKTGQPLPTTFGFVNTLMMLLSSDFRNTVEFLQKGGYASTPEESRLHPMASFGEWVDRSRHLKKSV